MVCFTLLVSYSIIWLDVVHDDMFSMENRFDLAIDFEL